MPDHLTTLAYVSRNAIAENGKDMIDEIGKILVSARKNNPSRALTGALLFSDNCFAQVLEGPEEAVCQAYETILSDPRHRDVVLLHREEVERRYFPDWSMAFCAADARLDDGLDLSRELTTRATTSDRTYGREIALRLYDLMRRRAQEAGDFSWTSFDSEDA